jgi:redox-sensitive bicupin YhaK (pirin superfamily)
VSNVEARPDVVSCESSTSRSVLEVLQPRLVPLGGPRALTVRRTLPQRSRSLIGAWCFADHYGPDEVVPTSGMRVPGHPHTGLQTVSWLFAGEIEHKDTIGTQSVINPGEMNLMTAGRGIAHSEFSTPGTNVLHGVQLWIALPERDRFMEPQFERYAPGPFHVGEARLSVFIGSLMGSTSPVRTMTRLVGAEITLAPGRTLHLDVDPLFEHGLLVDTGNVRVAGTAGGESELLYMPAGSASLTIEAGPQPVRVLLLGGEPLNERVIMWWNFMGRTHEEIVQFRSQWQAQALADRDAEGPFGLFPAQWTEVLPAPELPNGQLKPRP